MVLNVMCYFFLRHGVQYNSNGIYLYSQSTNASLLQYYTCNTKNVTAKTEQTK